MLVKIANTEDLDQTASSEAVKNQFDLVVRCFTVCLCLFVMSGCVSVFLGQTSSYFKQRINCLAQ